MDAYRDRFRKLLNGGRFEKSYYIYIYTHTHIYI